MSDLRGTPAERLARGLVVRESGCIEWTGYTIRCGYGRTPANGKQTLTHRLAWELANGPIPDGLFVLHSCDNPPCCNIEHLWLGTKGDNNADRDAKGRGGSSANGAKNYCKHGHPYDEVNTYIRPRGGRVCRTCTREAQRRAS